MDDIRQEIHDVFIAAQTPPHGVLVETVEKTVRALHMDAMFDADLLRAFDTDRVADLSFEELFAAFRYVNQCAKLIEIRRASAMPEGVTVLPAGSRRRPRK